MHLTIEDCGKRRLTERDDISTAVAILRSRGLEDEELLTEILRVFYLDLDEYNDLIRQPLAA